MKKQKKILKNLITKEWTLFLDRDGVINCRIPGDYVVQWEQFEFLPGVLEAIAEFTKLFGKIFIVTNQQGIGKGLMTEIDLLKIHSQMIESIEKNGGRIDQVYFCPFLKQENHFNRKPNIGMALKARKQYPGIKFNRSVMVGDSLSDMEFGAKTGMTNIYISENNKLPQTDIPIDFCYSSLIDFAQTLK